MKKDFPAYSRSFYKAMISQFAEIITFKEHCEMQFYEFRNPENHGYVRKSTAANFYCYQTSRLKECIRQIGLLKKK